MGTLVKKTLVKNYIDSSSTLPMASVKAFFDTIDCSLIKSCTLSSNTLTIGIDNTIQLVLNAPYEIFIYDDAGSKIGGIDFNTFRDSFNFLIYFTDTFFYLYFWDNYGYKYLLLYEKIDSKRYFGTTYTSESTQLFITDLTIKQVENQSYYKYNKLLNYSCGLDNIDYSSNILFNSNNEITDIVDTNTLTCSTVPTYYMMTFNGSNYYSLGANTLVEVDS